MATERTQWDRHLPDQAPPVPILPGVVSNGEFVPRPPTAHDRLVLRETLRRAEAAARRRGMDRRRFLQTTGGMAVVLGVLNACGGSSTSAAPSSTTTTTARPTTTTGGVFTVPEPEDEVACEEDLGGGEFIFDVHTHHVMPDGIWRQNTPAIADMILNLVPDGCVEPDPFDCLDRAAYIHDMFLASDTAVALLSDVPNSGTGDAPVPFNDKRRTSALTASLSPGGQRRVLVHDVIAPNFGPLEDRLELMEETAATGDVAAFKFYTAWGPGGQGFDLGDPAIGIPALEKARELGIRVICAHKGLPIRGFDSRFNGPDDVVRMAAAYPELDFVVFHSAYELDTVEGPYDPANAARGVNALVKALDDHAIPPNANVWADLGTTWREVLASPDEAAHVLGKLLSRVGEDRVLWGTDAIWFGSPQPQIMAFRAFQITAPYQEQFGYPELTPARKAKVLGLNAATLFGVDPDETVCAIDASGIGAAKAEVAARRADGALPPAWQPRGPVTRREVFAWLGNATTPFTPW